LGALAAEQFCYLATVGRRSGRPHTIEVWFGTDGAGLFLISGGADRSDWVRNLLADRSASVRVADSVFAVQARVPLTESDERERAVRLLHDKYGGQVSGTLADWLRDAFIVALDPIVDVDRSGR
jgi:deazaflavin-dependent oxidoreductase (nitroreductase family)